MQLLFVSNNVVLALVSFCLLRLDHYCIAFQNHPTIFGLLAAAPPRRGRSIPPGVKQTGTKHQGRGRRFERQHAIGGFRSKSKASTGLCLRNKDDDGNSDEKSINPRNNNDDGDGDKQTNNSDDERLLQARLTEMRRNMMELEVRRPPNPALSAEEFVRAMLEGLWYNGDPLPDSGFRLLLRASTASWRRKMYQAVGAAAAAVSSTKTTTTKSTTAAAAINKGTSSARNANAAASSASVVAAGAKEEVLASALGQAMGRPNNQFAILVGEAETYEPMFPSEPVDYSDGTCWVECQFRRRDNDELLVMTGWQLERRTSDGAWLVDGIDWQDFRDEYRPGIGREEWVRICG